MTTHSLPVHVQGFFADRLIAQMQASPHAVASNRDAFQLLLDYACGQLNRASPDLLVTDIDADLVGRFPSFVGDSRRNCAGNARRSAI